MLREILTLLVDKIPTQYYINFQPDRKEFIFQPTLNNKSAPAFTVLVEGADLVVPQKIERLLVDQAKEKVTEILNNTIFDQF
jgi:hypothetical protein